MLYKAIILLVVTSICVLAQSPPRRPITTQQPPSVDTEALFPQNLAGLKRTKVEVTASNAPGSPGYVAAAEYTDGLRLELRRGGYMASPERLKALSQIYKNRPERQGQTGYEHPITLQGYQGLETYVSYNKTWLCTVILGEVGSLSITSNISEEVFRKALEELKLKEMEVKLH